MRILRFAQAAFGCVLLAAATARAEDWPQWRGVRADGKWNGPAIDESWPAEGLPVAWRAEVGGGYSGIAVANGRVYTQDYRKQDREVERVLCFDAADGRLIWEHAYAVQYGDLDYGSGPRGTPTVYEGRVYTLGAVGHAHCLDAETGQPHWSHDLVKDFGSVLPEWGLAASPVVWQDRVVFHPGGKPGACFVAFDRQTGREMWRAGSDPAGYATPVIARHGPRDLLVGWTPEHVVGIDPSTGELLWQIPYKVTYGVSIATPLVHQGLVYVTGYWEGAKAIRLGDAPAAADLAWEDNRNLRGIMAPPLVRGDYVYSLDKTQGLTCFRLATGEKLWDDGNQLTPRDRNPQLNLVWLGESDKAIGLNAEGDLLLARLRPEGFEELARARIIERTESNPIWAHPAFAGRHAFARNDEALVCVELPLDELDR